ncbi:glycosyltransferase family 4 protein [Microbacterium oleivorans]|uniref:glycosyltransferase family 4 protein n=1 Tax=Microbacterium oleivorans TaxID=273677 RepID=UPI002042446B|nr:glycosyltransferase family 4 protein [Microbacterium oleivorans]MCM3697152.1 glycosyltransferase family 4 protein [Microbacterium oleivorans]
MNKSVAFFTGSSVIWGAELSLLTIATRAAGGSRLIASNNELVEIWRSQIGPAKQVTLRHGRLRRLLSFLPNAIHSVWRGENIVVFDFYLMPLFAILRPLAILRGARIVIDVHDALIGHPKRKPYFWLMRFAHRAICISKYIASQVPTSDKVVVYRPVEPASSGNDGSAGVVGIIGQISPRKGTAFAVEAAAAVDEVAAVTVRGAAVDSDLDYLESVLRTGEELLDERFRFEGRVPRDRVMEDIDILVVTNAGEPFGRVVAEAQLSGVVVVGPAAGGTLELVEHGVTGLLYTPGDVDELSDLIRLAIRDANILRAKAREFASSAFDPRTRAEEYMDNVAGA